MFAPSRFPFRFLWLLLIGASFAGISRGQVAPIQYSQIWGNNGSTWNRAVLKDWSKVGYYGGDAAIPNWATGVNVTSYGAVGNGTTDCTAAFNSALAACPDAAVFVPNGTYLISGYVTLAKNNTVLRGEAGMSVEMVQDFGNSACFEARFPLTGAARFFRVTYRF